MCESNTTENDGSWEYHAVANVSKFNTQKNVTLEVPSYSSIVKGNNVRFNKESEILEVETKNG